MKVTKDHVVSFDYQLRNSSAELLDSSEDSGPMAYLHGHGSIISGLEKALEGRLAGDILDVVVAPEDAYGSRDERRKVEVPRSAFPADLEIRPGMRFHASGPHGTDHVVVVAVAEDQVTVDANHPLAGQTLSFSLTIRDVRPATDEEISHGHAHRAGGCCGGHGHKHDDGECCGGEHAHDHGDGECCGGQGGCGGH